MMKLQANRRPLWSAEAIEKALAQTDCAELMVDEVSAPPAEVLAPDAPRPPRPAGAVKPQHGIRAIRPAEIAEVEALVLQDAFTSFRAFHAFSYSVSLLFYRAGLTYYVTLYQQERLWRALHSDELDPAQAGFRHFVELATRMTEVDLRRAQLEAQNQELLRMIEVSTAQAERLQIDLEHYAEQTQLANTRQQQARREVGELEAQRITAQAQLARDLRRIRQLRARSSELVPHLPSRRVDT
jgi:hypothetical protein